MSVRHLGFAIIVFGLLWFGVGWQIQFGEFGRVDPLSSVALIVLLATAIALFRKTGGGTRR